MKIRVLRNFDAYEAGQVFDEWPDGMCEVLIARGLIEERADPATQDQQLPPGQSSHDEPAHHVPAKRRKKVEDT